ncbi:MAG: FAD-binding oxidoreductase [Sedimentisphaerales bacterium]|nr:FAD-binding oxidoreductase [Sedimentisphaerales bacterium]
MVVVGAGIVGTACAMQCARRGLKVLVLDRNCVGGGTTAAGMGHLVVMDDSEAQLALTSYSRRLWHQVAPDLPAQAEYDPCGTLWVAADDEEMAEAQRKARCYTEHGLRAEILDADGLREAEPNLHPGLAGGLCVSEDGVVYPPGAALHFLEQARCRGADVRTNVEVRQLLPEGGMRLADGSQVSAGVVVIATGSWSPTLLPDIPVRKRKGHLVITDRYPGFARHQIVELGYLRSAHSVSTDSVAFNIQPRKTGQILIGSSRQYGSDHTEVEAPILARMLRRAVDYMPGLTRLSAIRTWTGFRPATPDKLPLIGPHPEHSRVWLATGHEGLGITTCLGTASLLADLILEQPTAIPAEPYAPARLLTGEAAHA